MGANVNREAPLNAVSSSLDLRPFLHASILSFTLAQAVMPDFQQALRFTPRLGQETSVQIDRTIQPHIQRVPRISPGGTAAEAS